MARRPKHPKPKPTPTYDYSIEKDVVTCFSSKEDKCTVKARLLEADESHFHDAALQRATQEINDILDGIGGGNRDRSRHLSFIDVQNRLMLVWSLHSEAVSRADTEAVGQALGLTEQPLEGHTSSRVERVRPSSPELRQTRVPARDRSR